MKPNKYPGHLVIGITGTIASGKSTACHYLASEKGAKWIDADLVARKVVTDLAEVLAGLFGAEILTEDGDVDRKALGAIVFSDPQKLELLNQTVHPETCRRIEGMIKAAEEELVIVEAIELLRSDLKDMIDAVWVVWAKPEIRIERMMSTRGLSREEAAARVASQLDDEAYRSLADRVIASSEGDVAKLERQIDEALESLRAERES